MKFEKKLEFLHKDKKCEFRTIFCSDITNNYISGLKKGNKYIGNIPINVNKHSQMKYINNIIESKRDTICGLFVNSELIGTAGIQYSYSKNFLKDTNLKINNIATIGIFIFNKNFRGKGYGKAMLWASIFLTNMCQNTIWFGVCTEKENPITYKLNIDIGFKLFYENERLYKFYLDYTQLIKPDFINRINVN